MQKSVCVERVRVLETHACSVSQSSLLGVIPLGSQTYPKGPKYLYGTKYGFCSSNFPYGLGKYSPYGYLGPFGLIQEVKGFL